MIRNGEVRNMRANFYAKDGTQIPCLMSGAMVELDGKLSVLTITRNIGDLLAAEQKLKESEASLRKIFDSILDPLSITDLEGRFVDVNDEFMRLSEFSRAEIIGTISPRVADNRYESEYRESLRATGQARNFEVTIPTKSGVEIPVLLSSVVVELGGEPRVVTIARDITVLKEQERKLQSSEAMLREIFDSSVDNIALTDLSDGTIIDVNNELVRSLGLAKDEIVGKRFERAQSLGKHRAVSHLFTATLLKQREVRNFETTFRTAGGNTFPALISAVVLELGGRECALSIARDITDLEAARQKALAASKAKTEFLSSMSHEIRTPMNAILGMADLIGESDLNSEQRRYLDTIISNGNALLELINSILDLARVESGRMNLEAVAFDVVELTEKVADTLAVRAHEKGIELAVRFSADLPPDAGGRFAAAAPGAHQSDRQRDQIYRARRGRDRRRAQSGPVQPRQPAVLGARQRYRNAARHAAQHLLRLHPGGFIDHAKIWRQRTRPDDRRAAGRADGRQGLGRKRARHGQHFLFYRRARLAAGGHQRKRSARASQARPVFSPRAGGR